MTLKSTPWAIGGGATHDPALARTLAYSALSGEQGIIQPLDLRVRQYATPSGNVAIEGGAAAVLGTYANQFGQAYVARNEGFEALGIPATTASPRSDLIVLRIEDPEYSGTVPADPLTHPYAKFERIAGVSSTATTAPGSYTAPHLVLARIDIPANTSAITQAMITDLRKMAKPRSKRLVLPAAGSGTETLTSTASPGQIFPAAAVWDVDVPSWATSLRIVAHWNGIFAPGTAGAQFAAQLTPRLGAELLTGGRSIVDRPTTADPMRISTTGGTSFSIPAAMRGTQQQLQLRAHLLNSSSNAARPQATTSTYVLVDIEFVEEPAQP